MVHPALGDGQVHVWCRTTAASQPDVNQWLSWLSEDERARADRFLRPDDRRDYLAAHALLRESLSRYASAAPNEWQFERTPRGKPHLAGHHRTPLVFSLSHTRGLAACAIAGAGDVGIDVEARDHGADAAIAHVALAASEQQALVDCTAAERSRRLLQFWTLKEAYVKATGEGIVGALDRVAFAVRGDDDISLVEAGGGHERWTFALSAPTPAHMLAVACRDQRRTSIRVHPVLDAST